MNINAGNILIILLGIVICFFGIYLKKVVQIILGFGWGVVFAYLFIMFLSVQRMINDSDEAIAVLIVLILGVLMAILAVKLERLLVTIQGVLLSMLITLIVCIGCCQDASTVFVVILLLIIAVVTGYLLWMYYRYAFICETAVIGAIMINHVWLLGSEDLEVFPVILTIAVAAAGIKVQSMWLKKMEGGTTKKRIKVERENRVKKSSNLQKASVSGLFSNEDVKKAAASDLCTYEKWLVLIPIFAFFIDRMVSAYMYDISQATIDFFNSTWAMRNSLRIFLEGAFVGCAIYFVIYYGFKVAAIYQLFYLLWLPIQIALFIQYSYVNLADCLRMTLAYYIPWIIFVGLDYILHSEKLKIIVMTAVAVLWFPFVSQYIIYEALSIQIDQFVILRWVGIVGTVLGLAWLRKSREQ